MSDQIGFHYQRYAARARGQRFPRQARGHRPGHRRQRRPPAHAGEHHPRRRELLGVLSQRGVEFLRGAVPPGAAASEDQAGAGRRLSGQLTRPPTSSATSSPEAGSSTTSASGSATPSATAPGTSCTRRGSTWPAVAAKKPSRPSKLRQAWKEMLIAEGSDWFWWFGDSHSCAQDDLFDQLFRKHLQNVYVWLGEEPPRSWPSPSARATASAALQPSRRACCSVKVDGRRTYFEWINAGHYVCGGSRGAHEHGHAGTALRPLFRLRHRAAVDAAGRPRRPVPRAIGRGRGAAGGFRPARGASNCRRPPGRQGAGGATAAARRGRWPGRAPRRRPT